MASVLLTCSRPWWLDGYAHKGGKQQVLTWGIQAKAAVSLGDSSVGCSSPSPGPSGLMAEAGVGNLRPQVRPETPEQRSVAHLPSWYRFPICFQFQDQLLSLLCTHLASPSCGSECCHIRDACDVVRSPSHVTESAEVPVEVPCPTSCLSHIPQQSFPFQLQPPSTPCSVLCRTRSLTLQRHTQGLRDNDLHRFTLPVVREDMSQTCCLCCPRGLLHPRWWGAGMDVSSETQQEGA